MNNKHVDVSVVIPAFNEEARLKELLDELMAVSKKSKLNAEFIIVDDGSVDETAQLASAHPLVDRVVSFETNKGRASAIHAGFRASTGDFIAVFDADFEYLPEDLFKMLVSVSNPSAVYYGSRYLEQSNLRSGVWGFLRRMKNQGIGPWAANAIIRTLVALIFWKDYTEHFSGIRIYPRSFVVSYNWKSSGFEGDHEIAAAAIILGMRVIEVPVRYRPRSTKEGKKIRAKDGLNAVLVFLSWRLFGSRFLEAQRVNEH